MSTPILEGEKGVWLTKCAGPRELQERVGSRECFDLDVSRSSGNGFPSGVVRLNREQAELVLAKLSSELGPTNTEMEAARWIGSARPLLEVLLRQKTTVGNEQLMQELVDTPWPDGRDWDEMVSGG
jgi:hypothetical protein